MMQLCNPSIKLLNKEIKKPIFEPNEKITPNLAFKSQTIRTDVIPKKSFKRKTVDRTAEELESEKIIRKERTYVVQAHIVKVMKSQKTYRF